MRLTLRTLLAWRDGTLVPADRADIAAKVADSPTAQTLASRIDRAVADDSLPPPQSVAAGEPNAVAEYLDNVLPGAALDSFELACMQSEALLGEVGASHRMLAELSLDPRLLPTVGDAELARLRARLESRRLAAAEGARSRPGHDPRAGGAAVTAEVIVNASAAREKTAAFRRRSSWSAWMMAATAIVLLALASGMLAWSVGTSRLVARRLPPRGLDQPRAEARQPDGTDPSPAAIAAPESPAAEPPAASADAADAAARPPLASVPKPGASPAAPADAVPAASPADAVPGEARVASALPPTAPASQAPAKETPAKEMPVQQATVPFGDALAIAAAPAGIPKPAGAPAPAPAPAAAAPPPPTDALSIVGNEVLLASPATNDEAPADGWHVVRGGDRPELPIRLLAPAWCRPAFEIDQARLVLAPGTVLAIDRDEDGVLRIALENGAVAAAGAPGPTDLRLTAEGIDGIATATAGAALGFEVQRGVSLDGDGGPTGPGTLVRIHATAAPVAWRPGSGQPGNAEAIPARGALEWTSAAPATAGIALLDHTPAWLVSSEPRDAFERGVRAALAGGLKSGDPAEPALLRMAAERRVERRIAAAATLARLGNYGPLAALLADDTPRGRLREEEWNRLEREAVPAALARGPREADAFARALEAAAPAGTGPLLVALAEGPGQAEADPRPQLVDALESPWLVVRRFAWRALLAADPPGAVDRIRYRPERPGELNAAGVRWWRERLAKAGEANQAQPQPARAGPARDRRGEAAEDEPPETP